MRPFARWQPPSILLHRGATTTAVIIGGAPWPEGSTPRRDRLAAGGLPRVRRVPRCRHEQSTREVSPEDRRQASRIGSVRHRTRRGPAADRRCAGARLTAANTALIAHNLSDALSVRDDVAGYRATPKIYPLIPSQVPFNFRNFAQNDRMNCSSATSNRGIDFFGNSDDRFCGRSCSRWLHGGPLRRDMAGGGGDAPRVLHSRNCKGVCARMAIDTE